MYFVHVFSNSISKNDIVYCNRLFWL